MVSISLLVHAILNVLSNESREENPEGKNKFNSFCGFVLPVRPTCARGRITVVNR